jgi:hypothetical protein
MQEAFHNSARFCTFALRSKGSGCFQTQSKKTIQPKTTVSSKCFGHHKIREEIGEKASPTALGSKSAHEEIRKKAITTSGGGINVERARRS